MKLNDTIKQYFEESGQDDTSIYYDVVSGFYANTDRFNNVTVLEFDIDTNDLIAYHTYDDGRLEVKGEVSLTISKMSTVAIIN